jgi:hypothetical protein
MHGSVYETVLYAFENDIDFAQLVKIYGASEGKSQAERKYSPAECTGAKRTVITGNPDPAYISTSLTARFVSIKPESI